MFKPGRALHRVSVVFKPEGEEQFSTEEQVTFSTEKNAREFLARQLKKESVLSARYISTEEHKK